MSTNSTSPGFAKTWWERVNGGEKIVQKCDDCGALQLHPRRRCNICSSATLSFETVSGHATIYSFTEISYAAPSDFVAQMPYILAVIRLMEGPQMLSRIVNGKAQDLRCDMPVKWTLSEVGSRQLPCFEPA